MRAVFFDAGGTLLHIDYERVTAVIRRVLGHGPDAAEFVVAEYAGRAAVEAAMAAGTAPSDTARWSVHFRAMLAAVGLTMEEYARAGPGILAEHRERHLWSVVRPGTLEALDDLAAAGWLVACVSNADGTVDRLLERAGLLRRLRFVVDSGRVGVEKPDPRIFAIALEQAGVAAAQSYYVGDIFPIDVVGARAAGMVPVLLDPLGRYGTLGCRTALSVADFCRQLVSLRDAA